MIAVDALGPVSISEKTSFRKISWSLESARFVFRIVRSLWNLTGTSAAVLPMCLSNFKAIRQFKVPISWLRDFTRSYEKTSFRILRRGPDSKQAPCYQQPSYWLWLNVTWATPYPEPVYTGWSSVHWNATGMPLVDPVYTGIPLEKLSWNSPTLECHWRNLVESAPHWDATGETLTFAAYTGTPLEGLWQPTHAPTHIVKYAE